METDSIKELDGLQRSGHEKLQTGRYLPLRQAAVFILGPPGVWLAQRHRVRSSGSAAAQRVGGCVLPFHFLWGDVFTIGGKVRASLEPPQGGATRRREGHYCMAPL